jgi:hypothetical protein
MPAMPKQKYIRLFVEISQLAFPDGEWRIYVGNLSARFYVNRV